MLSRHEQTEVILLFSLGVAQALKGAERTMLIQDKGGGVGASAVIHSWRGSRSGLRALELSQSDGMGFTVYPNNSSRTRGRVLKTF